jgi:hypothetical protein
MKRVCVLLSFALMLLFTTFGMASFIGGARAGASQPSITDDCSVDVSAQLDAVWADPSSLPDDTWTSPPGACYLVNEGTLIPAAGLIVNGGEFRDDSDTGPLAPIIRVNETDDIMLENLTLVGGHTSSSLDSSLVGEAGIEVRSSTGVTIDNVAATNTYGDGLDVTCDPGHRNYTPSSVTVNGFMSTNAGRDGITVAAADDDSTFSNITLTHSATDGIDFESDLSGVGSGDVTFNTVTLDDKLNMVEALTGPVAFNNMTFDGATRSLINATIGQPITFYQTSFLCERNSPVSCLTFNAGGSGGGPVYVQNSSLQYIAGKQPVQELAYAATGGVSVQFTNCQLIGVPTPAGTVDSESTVTFDNPPPTTAIVEPTSGTTLAGTVTLEASAGDPTGVTSVEFHLLSGGIPTDTLVATATDTPDGWVATWDTTDVPNNVSYNLQSVAYDAYGNSTYSVPVPVVVHN